MASSMQNGRSYVDKTLVGNWYESRLDEERAACTEQRLLRTGKVGKAPIAGGGSSDPDMYVSVNNGTYTPRPQLRPDTDVTMLTKETARKAMLNKTAPEDPGYPTELPIYDDSLTARQFVTSTHTSHGGKYSENPEFHGSGLIKPVTDAKPSFPIPGFANEKSTYKSVHVGLPLDEDYGTLEGQKRGIPSGKLDNPDAGKGVMSFGSTGERPKLAPTDDPKEHTLVQRSWVYSREINSFNGKRPVVTSVYDDPPHGIPGIGLRKPDKKQVFTRKNDTIPDGFSIWSDR